MAYDLESPSGVIADPVPQDKIPDKWTDDYAKRIVIADFGQAESYRTHAHDWRYRNADELYLGWVGQRYWEGTRVPRSSLGIYVVFEQVEAMLPKLVSAICSTDGYHFTSDQNDDDAIALAWKSLILDQLDETNFREQVRRAVKSALIYGNGILEVGMEEYSEEYVNFREAQKPTGMTMVNHPVAGPVQVPTGTETSYKRSISTEKKMRPYARYVSIKDFYVDPNCESTSLQDAGYVIKRQYLRASQVKEMGAADGFNLPTDAQLAEFSMAKASANQDITKQSAELFRYNLWNPALDYSADPGNKRIEVLEYTKRDRKVLMLGRDWVFYNKPNSYRCINFFSLGYADVMDRWHALALSDVAEGDQRFQTAVINARVDELALAIHPPTIKKRGVTIPAYQLRRKPGQVMETESPKDDIVQSQILNVTQQAFLEVEASERRVQRITGMSDLAALGSPSSGGNSANRSAAGVNTQAGATQERVKYQVENAEEQLIEPVLNTLIRFNKKFMDAKQAANWLKLDARFQHLDPEKVMNARVKAECRGSAKMASRQGFLQVFPLLAQTYLNPELLQLLATQQKKTMNAEELMNMLLDAINYSPKQPLIVDMSEDQIKQMQSPPPEAQMQMQTQQMQMQSDQQINTDRIKAKMFDTLLKEIFSLHGDMAKLDDAHLHKILELGVAANAGGDSEGSEGESGDSGTS